MPPHRQAVPAVRQTDPTLKWTMRNFLTLLLVAFLLTNCNNSQTKTVEKNDRLEHVPEPDKQERLLGEAIYRLKNLNCDFLEPDTSLSGIRLRNSISADKIIGTDNKTDESEQYHFYSTMDNETLTLTLRRACADIGLMFVAYNLHRLMNIIDKNAFQKFLKELTLLLFVKAVLLKAIGTLISLLKFINQFLIPNYKLVYRSLKLNYI